MEAILVHSPLVGPSSWRATARRLEQLQWRCQTPTPAPALPAWRDWVDALELDASPDDDPIVVIGHSAAGLLLPAIAERVGAVGLIFVDAQIPPESGAVPPADDEFLAFVRTLADGDGQLPPWSEWWGPGVMEHLIPDPAARRRFEAELPRLSLRWFEDRAVVPLWASLSAGYVQLSALFDPVAEHPRGNGWPVAVLHGSHVEAVTSPHEVASAINDVASAMLS